MDCWYGPWYTSNLWAKCPLYVSNATGRLISQEIQYRPLIHFVECSFIILQECMQNTGVQTKVHVEEAGVTAYLFKLNTEKTTYCKNVIYGGSALYMVVMQRVG